MTTTRVAFIGAGALASRYHYPSVATLGDVEIEAVAELNSQRAEAAAEKWGISKTYSDYKQMLEEVDPQAVYVIMPPQYLFDAVVYALKQGRHVFIEKPPGLTTFHTRVFADLAEKHGCLTATGFQRRHVPAMTALKKRVLERGPIHTVRLDFVKSTRRKDQHAGYYDGAIDPLTSDGIHAVDNLRWLAGGEVETVSSSIRTLGVPGPFPNTILAQVTFSSGAVGQLHFAYMTGRRIFRAEIHGPNVTAYVDPDRDSYIVEDDGEPEVKQSSEYGKVLADGEAPNPNPEPHHWLGFWHEHQHFIDCIKEGRQPSSHFRDAVKTMELVDRIYTGR